MVRRRYLTEEYVDNAVPPTTGELWIADTGIKGFGLRLWSARRGGQKAYAMRITSAAGKNVRKTYKIWDSWVVASAIRASRPIPSLGVLLYDAREWAKTEIRQAKDPGSRKRLDGQYRDNSRKIRSITLGDAAVRLLSNMRRRGLTESYVDQLQKLFLKHIPQKLQQTQLGRVRPKAVAKALPAKPVPSYNAMVLRSFISQIFIKASRSHGPFIGFPRSLSDELWPEWRKVRDVKFPELRDLRPQDYQKLFLSLEKEKRWQQALAIRLYFKFRLSLQVLLAGRWAHIISDRWYPYGPDERKYWTSYAERLDEEAIALLDRVRTLVERDFGRSLYFFPSPERSGRHIASVQRVWLDILERNGLRYYPLREFGLSYRDLNQPTHYRWLLEYYGPTFDRMENGAKFP